VSSIRCRNPAPKEILLDLKVVYGIHEKILTVLCGTGRK
jgi:hypothetical protein